MKPPIKRPLSVALPFRLASSLIRRFFSIGLKVQTPYGTLPLKIMADLSTSMGLGLYRYRMIETEVQFMLHLLEEGDTFIDGGANIGLYTLAAALKVGASGKVHSFEPASPTRKRLLENVALNSLARVAVHSEALGEKQGEVEFFVFDGNHSGVSSLVPAVKLGSSTEKVKILPLDDIGGIFEGASVRVIKLDLEGAEMRALLGAKRMIQVHSPDFLIEVEDAHLTRQGSSAREVLEFFKASGYQSRRFRNSSNYWMTRKPQASLPTSCFEAEGSPK